MQSVGIKGRERFFKDTSFLQGGPHKPYRKFYMCSFSWIKQIWTGKIFETDP